MFPSAKFAIVNLEGQQRSAPASTESSAADVKALALADRLVAFLTDINPLVALHLVDYHEALAQIAGDKEQGTVRTPGGALYPVHKQSRDARKEAQNALKVLVPAQRLARRLIQQLRFQPRRAYLPLLEEHLLSYAYQTPEALLFSDKTIMSRKERCEHLAHRFTWQTLTREQAVLALDLLARHPELFTWGPKFAAGFHA